MKPPPLRIFCKRLPEGREIRIIGLEDLHLVFIGIVGAVIIIKVSWPARRSDPVKTAPAFGRADIEVEFFCHKRTGKVRQVRRKSGVPDKIRLKENIVPSRLFSLPYKSFIWHSFLIIRTKKKTASRLATKRALPLAFLLPREKATLKEWLKIPASPVVPREDLSFFRHQSLFFFFGSFFIREGF